HAAPRDPREAHALFDHVAGTLRDEETGRTGITIYGADGTPIAWAGRVFDVPKERLAGPASLFVAPGAIGPRMVRVEPLLDRQARSPQPRIGTVVVEHALAAMPATGAPSDTFVIQTSLVPVSLRPRVGGAAPPSRSTIVVTSRTTGLSVEADVSA